LDKKSEKMNYAGSSAKKDEPVKMKIEFDQSKQNL